MKTRIGFVANSSSSSFLVSFPKIPGTTEALQKMLFADKKTVTYGEMQLKTKKIAGILLEMMRRGPIAKDALLSWPIPKSDFPDWQTNCDRGRVYYFEIADYSGEHIMWFMRRGKIFAEIPHIEMPYPKI